MFTLAPAEPRDVPGLTAIYNRVIETSTAVFSEEPVSEANRAEWLAGKLAAGFPVIVARDGAGAVLGFATYGDFRSWPGYRFTVEHSVHVREDMRGQGVGSALIGAVVEHARAAGKHAMVAGVDAANTGSIRLHERLGFVSSGRLGQVGFKFGRFLDLVFLVKKLNP